MALSSTNHQSPPYHLRQEEPAHQAHLAQVLLPLGDVFAAARAPHSHLFFHNWRAPLVANARVNKGVHQVHREADEGHKQGRTR